MPSNNPNYKEDGWQPGKSGNPNGRPIGASNLRSKQNQLMWRSKGYLDPLDFFGQIISDPDQPTENRLAAGNLAVPYLHSKLGAMPVHPDPVYMEQAVTLPRPTTIRLASDNIALLSAMKAQGKIDIAT